MILRDLPVQFKGNQGDLLIVAAAIGLGFAYIPGKRLVQLGDATQIIFLRLFVGSFFLLPFLALQANALYISFSWFFIAILVFYIVTNFGIGYVLLQVGLSLLQAWESSAILLVAPLFSTLFALLLLHDTLTLLQFLCGCLIMLGSFLII